MGGEKMRREWLLVVVGLTMALLASSGWAQRAPRYGMAGCGLGALAFEGQNDKVSQVLAATTNGTFGTQTFGITSGTSECTTDGVIRSERAQEAFAEANFESLTREMAQGEGEHLRAFAALMGCSDTSFSDFGRLTQRQYTQIVSHDAITAVELIDAVQRSIIGDPVLSRTCQG
jgi:hypothetical protein